MKEFVIGMAVSFIFFMLYLRLRRPYRHKEWERYKSWAPQYQERDKEVSEFQELYKTYLKGDWKCKNY